jgi:putative membrane protein
MYRSIRIQNVDPPSMRIQVEKPRSPSGASPVFACPSSASSTPGGICFDRGVRTDWLRVADPRREGEDIDPRFSYANERTFLAWNRTALALIGVGLAVANLLPPFEFAWGRRMIALPLIGLGGLVSIVSLREWIANERAMRRQDRLPGSRLPVLLAVVVGAVAVVAVVVSLLGATD